MLPVQSHENLTWAKQEFLNGISIVLSLLIASHLVETSYLLNILFSTFLQVYTVVSTIHNSMLLGYNWTIESKISATISRKEIRLWS